MGVTAPARAPRVSRQAWTAPVAVLALLTGAICVRRGIDGWPGATSPTAGLVFAGLLLAVWAGLRSVPSRDGTAADERWGAGPAVVAGLLGAALLCAGPLVFHLQDPGPVLPLSWFPGWAAVVSAVAVTEELVLRGTVWRLLVDAGARPGVVLAVTTLAFALLHVPFYGWESVPVNLAAGLVLGGLRLATGTVLAPAVTHTVADLAGWFLL